MEGRKLISLLKFYKKKNIEVELKTSLKEGFLVKGKIIKLCWVFRKYLVLQSSNNIQIKIFLDEVFPGSIIPVDFLKEIKKGELNKVSRSGIPPKLRFEVLRRDKYVCQYCGACGKNTELEVDHIIPVSRGGKDELNNLKTSCIECNRGKGGDL